MIAVLGALHVLILPRLRLLALLPPLLVTPTVFIASRTDADPVAAGVAMWPAMLVSGGILVYAAVKLARPVVEPRLLEPRARRPRALPPHRRGPAPRDR